MIIEWDDLFIKISIIGLVCSAIIFAVSLILLWLDLKKDKYLNKLVEETPILKYTRFLMVGVVLTSIFAIIIQLLKFIE